MNFLGDESVDHPIVIRLRADGHKVLSVAEMTPGLPDESVMHLANQEGLLLLTADKDFGEMVFRQKQVNEGVVLIRLAGLSLEMKAKIVSDAIRHHEAELPGVFTVISPGLIRIRPRP